MEKKPIVYISYAWEKQKDGSNWPPILKRLYKILVKEDFEIKIDIHSLNYKESIKSFMNELGRGQYVVTLINERYLKSINCMYEVLQLLKYSNYRSRIFPIILEGAKVYDSKKIIEYMKFWDSEINLLNKETKSLNNMVYARPIFEDIETMNEIRRIIASFGSTIGDMNVLDSRDHENSDFNALINIINKQFEEENRTENIEVHNEELTVQNQTLQKEISTLKSENSKLKDILKNKEVLIQELIAKEVAPEIELTESVVKFDISIFETLLGFNRNSTKSDIIKVFGDPTNDDEGKHKYDFNTMYYKDVISFSYYKKTEVLMQTSIEAFYSDPHTTIDYLRNKGIKDEKVNYLGVHKDNILKDFGPPSSSHADNYTYDLGNFDVNFICYDTDNFICTAIQVQYYEV